eukprot:GHVQ01004734.1.p1 GENE.GHVQ01004734.1~~GHVQ01004734.1.p1  ORF type:complete len:385 (-),score=11.61 GHVQ01004734.1:1576-2730(-)
MTFRVVDLTGTHREVGIQHGQLLSTEIVQAASFYTQYLQRTSGLSATALRTLSLEYAETIKNFREDLAEEIDSIADGAQVERWMVYMINCRTEFINYGHSPNRPSASNNAMMSECTAICMPQEMLLAQNWDFAEELFRLAVILRIRITNKPSFMTLTEPGMLGKIGLNSAGLGVCLNLLRAQCSDKQHYRGIPVHILLRVVLESSSLENAAMTIRQARPNTGSALLMSDVRSREGRVIEIAGTDVLETRVIEGQGTPVHTNHYLDSRVSGVMHPSACSVARYDDALRMVCHLRTQRRFNCINSGSHALKEILRDSSNPEYPILRQFKYSADAECRIGTICSVVLRLAEGRMEICRGCSKRGTFEMITLEHDHDHMDIAVHHQGT